MEMELGQDREMVYSALKLNNNPASRAQEITIVMYKTETFVMMI
jgi:hypothetical protein